MAAKLTGYRIDIVGETTGEVVEATGEGGVVSDEQVATADEIAETVEAQKEAGEPAEVEEIKAEVAEAAESAEEVAEIVESSKEDEVTEKPKKKAAKKA